MSGKITRDAFLYLENPDTPEFAQCETCWSFAAAKKRCAILGPRKEVLKGDTCGVYLEGAFQPGTAIRELAAPEEVGFIKGVDVRCENCDFGEDGICGLFELLNRMAPEVFNLDESIKPRGCCNGFMRKE